MRAETVRAQLPSDPQLRGEIGEALVQHRIGGLGWTRRSSGQLTAGERRRLLTAKLATHPRGSGFKGEFQRLIRREAAAVPQGRFALLVRCGLPLAIRFAPFAD